MENLTLRQGDQVAWVFTWRLDGTPVTLTGATARMQVRRRAAADTVLLNLTSPSGGIQLTSPGVVTVTVTSTQSAGIPAGVWRYDLEITRPGAGTVGIAAGAFEVTAEVTR